MVIGVAMSVMVVMRMAGFGFWFTLVPFGVGCVAAKARWRNRYGYEWVPVLIRWFGRRNNREWWTDTPWNGLVGETPRRCAESP